MNENEEITKPLEPLTNEPPEETVGDIMQKSEGEGLKKVVVFFTALVYLAGIVYAEVHGLTLLQKGVRPDMQIWAGMGMIAAGISAVLFPVAMKVWTVEATQRIVTGLFYLIDFAFLAFNAVVDFGGNTGQALPGWAQSYSTYVLPASPIAVAAMWAIVWHLDPSVRQKILQLTLRASMKEKMARKVADAAKNAHVSEVVNRAAAQEVDRALYELFGARPAEGYYVMDKEPRRGWMHSFFDWLSSSRQSKKSDDTD